MDLLWELFQEWQIGQANSRAVSSGQQAAGAEAHAQHLQDRVDKLTLLTVALWTLLRDAGHLEESALTARVAELSHTLHLKDGHPLPAVKACPKCGRTLSAHLGRCVFCGYIDPAPDPFAAL